MKEITSTGYPLGMSKVACEYRDVFLVIEACGSNLDAPEMLLSGGMFWGALCHEALPAISQVRGIRHWLR